MADRSLIDLDPRLQPIAQEFLAQCNVKLAPSSVKIIVTWRSAADQDAAKAEGLSKAGAGQSPHGCCLADGTRAARAFDFGVFGPDSAYVTNGTDSRYAQAGEIAVDLGLIYGGNWTPATDGCGPDEDHCEMTAWKTA